MTPERYRVPKSQIEYHSFSEWEKRISEGQIFGRPGEFESSADGSRVTCHLCGQDYKAITNSHLRRHGVDSAEAYRELLGLNWTQGLISLETFKKRSRRNYQDKTNRNFDGKRISLGTPENPRRHHLEHRLQQRKKISEQRMSGRKENILPPSSNSNGPETRRTHHGCIKVFSQDYYISRRVEQVSVAITDTEVIATWKDKSGSSEEKRFLRKDKR